MSIKNVIYFYYPFICNHNRKLYIDKCVYFCTGKYYENIEQNLIFFFNYILSGFLKFKFCIKLEFTMSHNYFTCAVVS